MHDRGKGGRPGASATTRSITFRVAEPETSRPLRGVRLSQDVRIPSDQLDFTRTRNGWSLKLPRPPVNRMEYQFELIHHDGGTETTETTETLCDPANPLRARGPFGEKSVLELPGYRRPIWLATEPPPGTRRPLLVSTRALQHEVAGTLWCPEGLAVGVEAPLLVVHDGPEYDELSSLTHYLAAAVATGALPPLRAALLAPGPRDEVYSASGAYTRALARAVLPRLRAEAATTVVIGMGASLGALAMLHAQRRHADAFDGLFLQSGSFFHPRYDAHERTFPRYQRIASSVDGVLRAGGHPNPVPVTMTCGGIEENVENNRVMARALGAQGYDAVLREVRDVHNYTAWRDCFQPHLADLIGKVLG